MKINSDMVLEYMKQWVDDERWTDLNACLNHYNDDLYAAHLLVSSGAIDSKSIKKHGAVYYKNVAYKCEREIEKLAREYRKMSQKEQQEHVKSTFQDCFIASCNDCNEVSFVPDENEEIYPELKRECWNCKSTNIETKKGL